MGQHLRLLLISVLVFRRTICSEICKPKIAIIGGGIGGASTAHFLTELFHGNLNIDLYEHREIGGRVATVELNSELYEAGGSVIHPQNKYMQEFVKLFGLQQRFGDNQKSGIWNGKEFVFVESSWNVLNIAKLLYRYGVQLFKLERYINTILKDFEGIYDLQNAGVYFMNTTSMLRAMSNDFPRLLQTSTKDELLNMGFSENFIDELVKVSLVVNYGQDTNVQAFVGAVSMAGATPGLWAVKSGNKEIPEHLIYRNKHVSVLPATVRKVRYVSPNDDGDRYEVHYTNKDSAEVLQNTYDVVILATPLTHDQEEQVNFENLPTNDLKFDGIYHTTVATFVRGELSLKYFGLNEDIDAVLSCNPNETKINSVGRVSPLNDAGQNQSKVWKIFSGHSLTSEFINNMFSQVEEVKEIVWKAYPEYSTNMRLDRFKLHEGLYHVNAIEWAASAMEMSAISGRNVALLTHREFSQKCSFEADNLKVHEETYRSKRSTEL